MTEPLTKKQRELIDFITEFLKMNGYAPSYREIADHFGLSSTATIHQHIRGLEDKGYLRVQTGKARSMELISRSFARAVELPLAGLIAAGEPIEAIEDNETITVPADLVRDDSAYVLRVKGDSMIEDGILDGDFVIVERNFYPKNGDVVVALLDNTYATLKRFYRERNRVRLQPANATMKPIYAKNPAIQGVVRGIYRKFQEDWHAYKAFVKGGHAIP